MSGYLLDTNVLRELRTQFADRILPVDERVADQWGCLGLSQAAPILDAFLAATALVHDLIVVSRDEEGFRRRGFGSSIRSPNPNRQAIEGPTSPSRICPTCRKR